MRQPGRLGETEVRTADKPKSQATTSEPRGATASVVDEGHLVLRRQGVGLGELERIGRRLARR